MKTLASLALAAALLSGCEDDKERRLPAPWMACRNDAACTADYDAGADAGDAADAGVD